MTAETAIDVRTARTIARIVKVNHAEEHAAIRIYQAQIACTRFVASDAVTALETNLAHERQHLHAFRQAMPSRLARPCRTMWLWALGGFVLGGGAGLLGRNGIWAYTAAVEEAVHRHLDDQLAFLRDRDAELYDCVGAIQREEEHLARAVGEIDPRYWLFAPLTWIIARATNTVIWLSTWGNSVRLAREMKLRSKT